MNATGPILESLTHRLAECPTEFLLPQISRQQPNNGIDIAAIACDQLRAMGYAPPANVRTLIRTEGNAGQFLALAAWLFYDEWFISRAELAPRVWKVYAEGFESLANVVKPQDVVRDPDRREEFVRRCLHRMGLTPACETEAQAIDRLNALDSIERVRVTRATREAEARARQIREAMAKKAAEAAAARYSPE